MSSIPFFFQKTVKAFYKSEKGVVALIFAIMCPIIVLMLVTAFQFEQYNRFVTRVQQAQSSALQGARLQTSETNGRRRQDLTSSWVRLNSLLAGGFALEKNYSDIVTEDFTSLENKKTYLKIDNIVKDSSPIHWLLSSSPFSMRIPVDMTQDQWLDRCRQVIKDMVIEEKEGDRLVNIQPEYTSNTAVENCGVLPISALHAIDNKYRVKADQLAMYNMAKGFFRGKDENGNVVPGKPMTKKEIESILGKGVSPNSAVLMFNYRDWGNETLEGATTDLKTDSGFGDFYYWLQGEYDNHLNGKSNSAKLNDFNKNYNKKRLFLSDWMLESNEGWMNGKPDYTSPGLKKGENDNYRSVRAYFTFDSNNTLEKVRITVNRGSSTAQMGSYFYDLNIVVTASQMNSVYSEDNIQYNNANPDLDSFMEKKDYHGVVRPENKTVFENWLYEYYFRLPKDTGSYDNNQLVTKYEARRKDEEAQKKGSTKYSALSAEDKTYVDNIVDGEITQMKTDIAQQKASYDVNDLNSYRAWYTKYLKTDKFIKTGNNGSQGGALDALGLDAADIANRIAQDAY